MTSHHRREFLQTVAGTAVAAALAHQAGAADVAAPIKIGQIGTGHAHANKLGVYRQSPDYEVVGIVEADPDRRRAAERQPVYQGLPWLSQDELLATRGLQAVLVETEVAQSLDVALACVQAGKHIHLDKPAGASLPLFRRVLAEAERQKLLVQMGYMYRYNPGVVLLREFLAQGWLGEVFEVHAVMSKVIPPKDRRELAKFSGGVMFELGCHLIDLVVGILGRPLEVTPFQQHVSAIDDGLQDSGLAVLTYPRATATIRTTGMEVAGGERRHLTVCGSAGTFHIQPLDNPQVRVALDQPRGEYRRGYQDIKLPAYARYVDDAADMVSILRGTTVSRFPYAHDLSVQETVLASSKMPQD